MHAENTILVQFLQAVLGILLVTPFCGCKTPKAITPDSPIAKHDQEMPSLTIHTNYAIPQGTVSIYTNYPSPRALLWGDNGKYPTRKYPIYLEQDDSERAFWQGIGGILQWCEPILEYYTIH